MTHKNWTGFKNGVWQDEINVRDFIQCNYKEYTGDESFLSGSTSRTDALMEKVQNLFLLERQYGGVLDIDTATVSSLTSFSPGYIDKNNEIIVGMQTNRPLKRAVNPFGGMRMAKGACEAYGFKLSHKIEEEFKFRTTHNDGVFRAYTDEMRAARKCHVITGLPDAYGRGRIIGDYRRVALYGVDKLIEEKQKDKAELEKNVFDAQNIRLTEEVFKQISFLKIGFTALGDGNGGHRCSGPFPIHLFQQFPPGFMASLIRPDLGASQNHAIPLLFTFIIPPVSTFYRATDGHTLF